MSHFIQKFTQQFVLGCLMSLVVLSTHAGKPLFILTPVTPTTISVPSNSTAQVQYTVTNNTKITRTLTVQAQTAITQSTSGAGICASPFTLIPNQSCTLTLTVDGATLAAAASPVIASGPIVCKTKGNGDNNPDPFLCAQPAVSNALNITLGNPLTTAEITVSNSPLALTASDTSGILTINNTSTDVTATNINADLTGPLAAAGVTQTGTTCSSVAPSSSCTLTFTRGDTAVSQTDFPIQGDNTTTATGAISVSTTFTGQNTTSFPIIDFQTINSPIIVPDSFTVTSVVVVINNLTHTWDGDLVISLVAADGTIIPLSSDNGGSGNNYIGTEFTMSASTSITTGTPPFTGQFIPEGNLSLLNGSNANGTWYLRIFDDAGADSGALNSWTLKLN